MRRHAASQSIDLAEIPYRGLQRVPAKFCRKPKKRAMHLFGRSGGISNKYTLTYYVLSQHVSPELEGHINSLTLQMTASKAPAFLECSQRYLSSACVSVPNWFTATTTGMPYASVFLMWRFRFANPSRSWRTQVARNPRQTQSEACKIQSEAC